ncbi:non-ribosomal peptide synthetase [Desulfoluna spongiiphila]|uniref:non-ribosomal peptide synthetase n=1 Tax=Desulfoluna spongiiphila TaxID=419481 RepID=UPI0012575090|nr:non-ribosomal peptide synthetase [Desulfoluna spongiiphila]VVS93827.1 amp-dependent synthetase/ligase [Desulfoluna spongiiphila]
MHRINKEETNVKESMSIVEMIDHCVRMDPEHTAIETPTASLTYGDLDKESRSLVSHIERMTVPGEFVGIEGQRNAATIVAMVGLLRAHRPFVVIDPRDSAESNRSKISRLRVNRVAQGTANPGEVELVPTPSPWRGHDTNQLTPRKDLHEFYGNIAYAIHTSGSTGEPKCVIVARDSLNGVITDHRRRLEVGPQSRTLQFAKLTFDGCLTEIFWTLCAGARLVMVDESALTPGAVLQDTLTRHAVTHLKTTPFALTATEPTPGMHLRHVLNGGGACRPAVVEKWARIAAFHNAYGCTETTICNLLTDGLSPEACRDGVPLGDVVGECGVKITRQKTDNATGPSSDLCGELVITGKSVAIGYLTDDGLQRFSGPADTQVYPTGDIVTVRDGQFFFVERCDRQVKVRGYRIDPGEVESVACRLDTVVEAVVLAESHAVDQDAEATDALVCYYQGAAEPRMLRRHLEAHLNPYKVPSLFKRLDIMPYTRNGKVDRHALQATRTPIAGEAATVEAQVMSLVQSLTGLDDAHRNDNFFDIGGDSASTLILLGKLKELGWTDVGVRDVLRAATLGDLIDAFPGKEAERLCAV